MASGLVLAAKNWAGLRRFYRFLEVSEARVRETRRRKRDSTAAASGRHNTTASRTLMHPNCTAAPVIPCVSAVIERLYRPSKPLRPANSRNRTLPSARPSSNPRPAASDAEPRQHQTVSTHIGQQPQTSNIRLANGHPRLAATQILPRPHSYLT